MSKLPKSDSVEVNKLCTKHVYQINQCLIAPGREDECAGDYEQQMRGLFSDKPVFDTVLLGQGPDGHTASLFPGHPLVEYKGDAWVKAVVDSPKPPPRRITLTLPVLCQARNALFVVTGSSKRQVVKEALDGDSALPSALVTGNVTWLLDPDAAQDLKSNL